MIRNLKPEIRNRCVTKGTLEAALLLAGTVTSSSNAEEIEAHACFGHHSMKQRGGFHRGCRGSAGSFASGPPETENDVAMFFTACLLLKISNHKSRDHIQFWVLARILLGSSLMSAEVQEAYKGQLFPLVFCRLTKWFRWNQPVLIGSSNRLVAKQHWLVLKNDTGKNKKLNFFKERKFMGTI